jgi:glycine/sarcosine N-methyltransferase
MIFYTSIHPWYDEIFPFVPAQRDFVLSYGTDHGLSIADVGCGTGSLIISLAQAFRKTAGLDPDESMLEAARKKAAEVPEGTWFIKAGMLDLAKELAPRSVDRLICFGNTLPHLASDEEVREFVRQAAHVLYPDGLIFIQLINYDRIFNQKLTELPPIENDVILFERFYEYPENPTHVLFKTRLTIKAIDQVIENEVPLLAIRPSKLRSILEESGFNRIEEFGSFKKEPVTPQSQPYIITGRLNR